MATGVLGRGMFEYRHVIPHRPPVMSDSLSVCVTRFLPRAKYDNWVCVHNFLPTDSGGGDQRIPWLWHVHEQARIPSRKRPRSSSRLADNPGFIARLYDGASIVPVFSPAAVVIV